MTFKFEIEIEIHRHYLNRYGMLIAVLEKKSTKTNRLVEHSQEFVTSSLLKVPI